MFASSTFIIKGKGGITCKGWERDHAMIQKHRKEIAMGVNLSCYKHYQFLEWEHFAKLRLVLSVVSKLDISELIKNKTK